MKIFEFTVSDKVGIHARPAGLLVKTASKFKSKIEITLNRNTADAKRLFSVMGLGVQCGDKVAVTALGEDENEAIKAVEDFMKGNL